MSNPKDDQRVMKTVAELCRVATRQTAFAAVVLAFLSAVAWSSPVSPQALGSSAPGTFLAVDWQPPLSLPPRFRNHCHYDADRGVWYCSNHCGIDYQFYYCSPVSFGCCRPGYGYCDWHGHLRCAP